MADSGTDVIAGERATVRGWFSMGRSLPVADPKRFPDEREETTAVQCGVCGHLAS
jgi:hypothetical protein